jgi:hypothetical protein
MCNFLILGISFDRRSWCCSSEGALLLHTMDVVIPRLKDEKFASVRDKLIQGLEQVFFCLYAHPNKKTKVMLLSTRFHFNALKLP